MKAYRESYLRDDGRRGLSQDELLRRMGSVDAEFGERFSHATVSRWESGATRPTARRLEVFANALDLSPPDLEILLLLAGLQTDPASTELQGFDNDKDSGAGNAAGTTDVGPVIRAMARLTLSQYLPFAALIVLSGSALSLLDWDALWTPSVYVAIVTLLVVGGSLVLADKDDNLRDLLTASLFFVLTTPLLQYMPLRMDQYSFYAIDGFFDSLLPYMGVLLVNLTLAYGAGMLFHLLREWRGPGSGEGKGALRTAIRTVTVPVGLVYAVLVMISNISIWIQLAVLLPSLSVAFIILLVLRDPRIRITAKDRQFLLWITAVGILVASFVGIITVVVIYVSPELPRVLPDHNLFRSWEIDFAAMGYSREEALERVELGYMWHAMFSFAYMFLMVAGHVMNALYRMGEGEGFAGKSAQNAKQ